MVIPVYNEEKTIRELIDRARAFGELIIVNDGSTDSTKEIAESTGVKVITHASNAGYSAALRTGYANATREVIAIIDSDLQMVPEELPRLVLPVIRGEADLVIGSKFMGTLTYRPGIPNYLMDRVVAAAIRLKFGVKLSHSHSGFRAFRRSCLDFAWLKGNAYEGMLEMDFLFASKGYRIQEVPRTALKRKSGRSGVRTIDGLRILVRLVELLGNRSVSKNSLITHLY